MPGLFIGFGLFGGVCLGMCDIFLFLFNTQSKSSVFNLWTIYSQMVAEFPLSILSSRLPIQPVISCFMNPVIGH